MAAPALVATSPSQVGVAALDASTAVHFGIGTAAGLGGIDPKIALLVALLAEGTFEVLKSRDPQAVFHRGTGQSKINEIFDLLAIVAGAYAGQRLRALRQQPAVALPAPPVVPPPTAAGLFGYSW